MKWLAWLDTSSSDAFAHEIAEEFTRNFQTGPGVDPAKSTDQRLARAIDVMANRAVKFQKQNPLGWFRKARFMNTVTDCLREKHHDQALIDRVVYEVALRMARSRG